MPLPWSILQITDLHYEDKSANFIDDDKASTDIKFREEIFPYIRNILRSYADRGDKFDLVAMCGDFTTHGSPEGFRRYSQQLWPELGRLVRSQRAICMVPGNHDVKWGLDSSYESSVEKFKDFKTAVQETGATSSYYPEVGRNGLHFSGPPGSPIFLDRGHQILGLCINSAMRCGERQTVMQRDIETALKRSNLPGPEVKRALKSLEKYLVKDVSEATAVQIQQLRERLTEARKEWGSDWDCCLKVAILHHHLVHFRGQVTELKDHELMNDSDKLLGLLNDFDFDLVLTGHKHQRYDAKYQSEDREILLVGGPTVGGQPASDGFRGFRTIKVERQLRRKAFFISDIPWDAGRIHVDGLLGDLRPKELFSGRPTKAAFAKHADKDGFAYRSLISVTVLSEDGDAQRFVECNDMTVSRASCDRATSHKIRLPVTAGYYDCFRATSKNVEMEVDDGSSSKGYGTALQPTLRFVSPVVGRLVSYKYEWWTINSFAMDQRQYQHVYAAELDGRRPAEFVEFTHFVVRDPTEELIVVVKFPKRFQPSGPPKLRITCESDRAARTWEREQEIERDLSVNHALYYVDSINAAALRVRYPQPGLSYGIEWNLPKTQDNMSEQKVQKLMAQLAGAEYSRQRLLDALKSVIVVARKKFLQNWPHSLHCSLMRFDRNNSELRLMCAADEARRKDKRLALKPYEGVLHYGDGIAGRAFKTNRLTGYVAPDKSQKDGPDYYRGLPRGASHKALISIPLCIPVKEKEFRQNNKVYKSKEPYGVINIGSDDPRCPLSRLKVKENIPSLLAFHHIVNSKIYRILFRSEASETVRRVG